MEKTPKTLRKYSKFLLGNHNNEPIYLYPPSWNCGWYWGFGYLGNKNCHYHLSGISNGKDLHTGLKEHFGETLKIKPSDLWTFAELINSAYKLKEAAEVLGRGGSHLTSNPCKEIIKNKKEVKRINYIVLPAIFDEIYKIIDRNKNNDKLFKKLVEIDNKGLTSDTIDFMFLNNIKPEDLKIVENNENYNHKYINGISKYDYSRIHSSYYHKLHRNTK